LLSKAVPIAGCPDCGAIQLTGIGVGVSFGRFAGGAFVDSRRESPVYYQCSCCNLVFKCPRLTIEECVDLYNKIDGSVWDSGMPRPECDAARNVFNESVKDGGLVLDFGCNQGAFLSTLQCSGRKFGIEVNHVAAAQAERYAECVWSSVSEIPNQMRFQLVTCFDVIEHIAKPSEFMISLLSKVESGGYLILSSGDAEAFIRQPKPALNWYFSNPEHISFISDKWIEKILSKCSDFEVQRRQPFLHGTKRQGLVPLVKIAAFKIFPRLYLRIYAWLKLKLSPQTGLFVPGNGFSKDHVYYVIRKSFGQSSSGRPSSY
jgi:SAM-dependent methyltransferase